MTFCLGRVRYGKCDGGMGKTGTGLQLHLPKAYNYIYRSEEVVKRA